MQRKSLSQSFPFCLKCSFVFYWIEKVTRVPVRWTIPLKSNFNYGLHHVALVLSGWHWEDGVSLTAGSELKVWDSKESHLLTDWTMLEFQPGHFLLQPLDPLVRLWRHVRKDHYIHITYVDHQTRKYFERERIARAKMVAQNKQRSEKMAAVFCHNEKRRCVCVSGSLALLSSHLLSVICSWASSAGIKCRLQIEDVCVIETHKTDTHNATGE